MRRPRRCGVPTRVLVARRGLCWTLLFACVAFASGCAPKPLYNWNLYENSLQASYVAHDDAQAWSGLEATIASVQQTGGRFPPGVCAEYGFMLYKRGDPDRAVAYFQQEASLFPESKPLMDRLIAKVKEKQAPKAGADTSLPAAEGTEP